MKEKLVALVLLVVLVIGIFVYAISNRYQMKPSHVDDHSVHFLDVWRGDYYLCRIKVDKCFKVELFKNAELVKDVLKKR